MDVAAGLFLAASPWLLGFAEVVFWPHLLVGLFEVGIAFMSRPAASLANEHPVTQTPAQARP
jgi:hypothetical protein